MDALGFDHLARRLGQGFARRATLRLLAGVLAAGFLARDADDAGAACLKPGKSCKRGGQCCSGRCAGKKGKQRCKAAPNQGICTARDNACFGDDRPEVVCGKSAGVDCLCFRTKSGEAFCADTFAGGNTACTGDADCVDALGVGARCIQPAAACGQQAVCKLPCPVIKVPIP